MVHDLFDFGMSSANNYKPPPPSYSSVGSSLYYSPPILTTTSSSATGKLQVDDRYRNFCLDSAIQRSAPQNQIKPTTNAYFNPSSTFASGMQPQLQNSYQSPFAMQAPKLPPPPPPSINQGSSLPPQSINQGSFLPPPPPPPSISNSLGNVPPPPPPGLSLPQNRSIVPKKQKKNIDKPS